MDVLAKPVTDELRTKLGTAGISVDFSASVAVARWLSLDAPGDSRRISVFLNPAGSDLVLMAEDPSRLMRLDHIESQYYRAVIEREDLARHLQSRGERRRYGHGCRDVTRTIPQDLISLFSGIAAREVRETIKCNEPRLAIWRTSAHMSVSYSLVELAEPSEVDCGDWTSCTDKLILKKLHELRRRALPN